MLEEGFSLMVQRRRSESSSGQVCASKLESASVLSPWRHTGFQNDRARFVCQDMAVGHGAHSIVFRVQSQLGCCGD